MLHIIEQKRIKNGNWLPIIEKMNASYNLIIGGRNGRKSTKIQLKLLDDFEQKGDMFLLIRRKTDEIVNEKWFTPYIMERLKKKNKVITFTKALHKGERYTGYFILSEPDGTDARVIGKVMYLAVEQKYKSNEDDIYSHFTNVVFEEFIANTNKDYLINEVQKLINIISTVFREKEATIYLIGNTIEEQIFNPYFRFFELDDLTLNINDVILTENEYKTRILVCYVENTINREKMPQHLLIAHNEMVISGEWKDDGHITDINIKRVNGEIEYLNIKIGYRNRLYYVYSITEKNFSSSYIYITTEALKSDMIADFNAFLNSIPERHRKYKPHVLHAIYPEYFEYDFIKHQYVFSNKAETDNSIYILIDGSAEERERAKEAYYQNMKYLNDVLYNKQVFCNNKSLYYWLREERKKYINNLF